MSKQSKNDRAWQAVFDHSQLLRQIECCGHVYISADTLRRAGHREPRLMAKQDTLHSRPAIFRQHALSIFPVANGRYVIFHDPDHKSYFCLDDCLESIPCECYAPKIDLRRLDSFPSNQQFSESQALDFAFTAGLLQHFLQDEQLTLTIRGRLRSGNFSFGLPVSKESVNVAGVQIEVDAGYESPDGLYLFEAKVGKRDDFHIRQLLYPWLEWSQKTDKAVIPVLLIYSNGQYYLLQFQFSTTFGDLRIVKSTNYTLNEDPGSGLNLLALLREIPREDEQTGSPYPQADDLDKVVDVILQIHSGIQSKTELAEYFDFDERQGDYYLNAAAYLAFLTRRDRHIELTDLGREFVQTPFRSGRTRLLITQLLKRPSFREMLDRLLSAPANMPLFEQQPSVQDLPHAEIVQIIRRHTSLNDTTARRRADTARSWMKWVLRNSGGQVYS